MSTQASERTRVANAPIGTPATRPS
jgi:hypothetical protein